MLNAIAENLDLTVEYQDTGFRPIFRDVAAGQFDTAAAASTIKPGAREAGGLHRPLLRERDCAGGGGGLGHRLRGRPERQDRGAQDGTIQEDYANEETDASEVRGFPEGTNALSSLLTGARSTRR